MLVIIWWTNISYKISHNGYTGCTNMLLRVRLIKLDCIGIWKKWTIHDPMTQLLNWTKKMFKHGIQRKAHEVVKELNEMTNTWPMAQWLKYDIT